MKIETALIYAMQPCFGVSLDAFLIMVPDQESGMDDVQAGPTECRLVIVLSKIHISGWYKMPYSSGTLVRTVFGSGQKSIFTKHM
jgi:hypothetical protein